MRKKCWFSVVKRLFVSGAKEKEEKRSKRWRWVFTKLKLKQCPAIAAPRRTLSEARDEHKRHALTVALATAAAAEAAVAAAHAAAEVLRLTSTPQSCHSCDNKAKQNLAATKIQTAFRGHHARKALQALKGLVRLQALICGQILRRQVIARLKCLPSTANNRAQVNKRGFLTADGSFKDSADRKFLRPKELGGRQKQISKQKLYQECFRIRTSHTMWLLYNIRSFLFVWDYVIEELEGSGKKGWDCSLLLKEDVGAMWLRKQDAIIKRERMKQYSSSHWERIAAQATEELENSKSTIHLNMLNSNKNGKTNVELRNAWKQNSTEGSNYSFPHSRRSFCDRRHNLDGDKQSFPNSPVFRAYMAATESAKAKARSMSMPKQRVGFLDSDIDHSSPKKNQLSSWSSLNGCSTSNIGKNGTWKNFVTMRS